MSLSQGTGERERERARKSGSWVRKEGSASYAIADSDYEGGRKGNVWQNTPAHCSIHFDIRQDGRMGPAVVISVVRRSRSHLKKKLRYESVQLREYRGILQNPPARQMVSVIHQFILFFSISHVEMPRRFTGACCLLGAPIFKNRMAAAGLRNARRAALLVRLQRRGNRIFFVSAMKSAMR